MLLGSRGRVSQLSDSSYYQFYANITQIIMCTDIAILNYHNQTDTMSFFKNKLKSNSYRHISLKRHM